MKLILEQENDSEMTLTLGEQKKEMKEGDYLRQRVTFDEDDDEDKASGCLAFRPRASTLDSPQPPARQVDVPHHGRFAEKLLRFFRSKSDHAVRQNRHSSTNNKPTPPRRRFMRVVSDENAPPPECVGENPNIICKYSQEYLTKYYATGGKSSKTAALPYVTSGHTILKKSSTDPTHNRSASAPTTSVSVKHTTFSDVVQVVESGGGEVREERLHSDDVEEDEVEMDGGRQKEFFLSDDTDTPARSSLSDTEVAVAMDEDSMSVERTTLVTSQNPSSTAMMSVFTSLGPVEPVIDGSAGERRRSSTQMTTRHVKLADILAQNRDLTRPD